MGGATILPLPVSRGRSAGVVGLSPLPTLSPEGERAFGVWGFVASGGIGGVALEEQPGPVSSTGRRGERFDGVEGGSA